MQTHSSYDHKQEELDGKRVDKYRDLFSSTLTSHITVRKHNRSHGSDQENAVTDQEIHKSEVVQPFVEHHIFGKQREAEWDKFIASVAQYVIIFVFLDVEAEESQPQDGKVQDIDSDLFGKE